MTRCSISLYITRAVDGYFKLVLMYLKNNLVIRKFMFAINLEYLSTNRTINIFTEKTKTCTQLHFSSNETIEIINLPINSMLVLDLLDGSSIFDQITHKNANIGIIEIYNIMCTHYAEI